jgi:hypothetical protein
MSLTTEARMISMSESPLIPTRDAPMPPTTEAPIIPLAKEEAIPEPAPEPAPMNIAAAPSPVSSLSRRTLRKQITWMTTRYIAAAVIAEPDFPALSRRPRHLPPPFSNFGHQVLFDYRMLVQMVWQVATEVREATQAMHALRGFMLVGILCAGMIGIPVGYIADQGAIVFASVLGVLLAIGFGRPFLNKRLRRRIAKVRARALEALILDQLVPRDGMVQVPAGLAGNGELGTDRIPIVTVVHDSQPFSGYGRLRMDNLFVCRPKDGEAGRCSMAQLDARAQERIMAKVRELHLPETTVGSVVVLHGESLSLTSPWLDSSQAPRLWLRRDDLPAVYDIDPMASVRVYLAIQIVFPQHMTAATFFVRLFQAGNGAAFQIAVTTLGPPRAGFEHLTRRLLENLVEERTGAAAGRSSTSLVPAAHDGLLDPAFAGHVDEVLKSIAAFGRWPVHLQRRLGNWREATSLTFPDDFFGRPESIASVRTVYDQLGRALLDTLDENGFDISDYRDSEGRYAIHAEKIEQLVVGERIHMDSSRQEAKHAPESANEPHEAAA